MEIIWKNLQFDVELYHEFIDYVDLEIKFKCNTK